MQMMGSERTSSTRPAFLGTMASRVLALLTPFSGGEPGAFGLHMSGSTLHCTRGADNGCHPEICSDTLLSLLSVLGTHITLYFHFVELRV